MGRARNITSAARSNRRELFNAVLGSRHGIDNTNISLASRLLAATPGHPRDEGEGQALIDACENGRYQETAAVAAELIAAFPSLLNAPAPTHREPGSIAARYLHAFFEGHCRSTRQAWGPVTPLLLRLCGYPTLKAADAEGVEELPLVGADYPNFIRDHRLGVMHELREKIEAATDPKTEAAILLEVEGTPVSARWLLPAVDWKFRMTLLDMAVAAITDNDSLHAYPSLTRAITTAGAHRLSQRKGIGSIRALQEAVCALPAFAWREVFMEAIGYPVGGYPVGPKNGHYPGPACDPANPLPDLDERKRRLEKHLATLLAVQQTMI